MTKKTQAPSLEDWISSVQPTSQGASWKKLPPKAIEEIQKVLDHNDANPSRAVPQPAFIKRLQSVYGVKVTKATLNYYLNTVLGRHWRKNG